MEFKNLTPHALHIYREVCDSDGKPTGETVLATTLPPDGEAARCVEKSVYCWTHAPTGIDAYRTDYGEVTGLPPQAPGVFLIVSAMVRMALPERPDLCSPGKLLRDPALGTPIGCIGLNINKQR